MIINTKIEKHASAEPRIILQTGILGLEKYTMVEMIEMKMFTSINFLIS